jgi:lipopolysaccharide transport system permease protein
MMRIEAGAPSRVEGLAHLWRYRDLIRQLTEREIAQRYRGLYLGFLWSLITPLLMLAIYTFVFVVVLKARWDSSGGDTSTPYEFALVVFAGLIPFNMFAETLNAAPRLILEVPNYVSKVVFPLEILPLAKVGSALVHSLLSIGVLLVGILLLQHALAPTILLLPLAYVPLVLLCLGLMWLLASLGVFVRDIVQTVAVATQVLFFLSPVVYPVTAVPEQVRWVLYLNPLTAVLTDVRRTLLWGQPPDWGPWLVWTTLSAAFTVLAYVWFFRTKRGFADVL